MGRPSNSNFNCRTVTRRVCRFKYRKWLPVPETFTSLIETRIAIFKTFKAPLADDLPCFTFEFTAAQDCTGYLMQSVSEKATGENGPMMKNVFIEKCVRGGTSCLPLCQLIDCLIIKRWYFLNTKLGIFFLRQRLLMSPSMQDALVPNITYAQTSPRLLRIPQ